MYLTINKNPYAPRTAESFVYDWRGMVYPPNKVNTELAGLGIDWVGSSFAALRVLMGSWLGLGVIGLIGYGTYVTAKKHNVIGHAKSAHAKAKAYYDSRRKK